jgi:hypothetical protein
VGGAFGSLCMAVVAPLVAGGYFSSTVALVVAAGLAGLAFARGRAGRARLAFGVVAAVVLVGGSCRRRA